MDKKRILIFGGRVIDTSNGLDKVADIEIENGKISKIGENLKNLETEDYDLLVDATDCLVTPGLIDCHAHVYEHATVLGVNPDKTCLARGVTTVVDGGSSGAMTFQGLRKFIIEKSDTRVLAFLHIACHGLSGAGCSGPEFGPGGESDHLNAIKTDLCANTVMSNSDVIVGVKVRLDVNITDQGRTEHELYLRAIKAAAMANVPLMVHHTNSEIPLGTCSTGLLSCPGSLKPGDIYTHTFHGNLSSILDRSKGEIDSSVIESQKNGILFDVGHGQGSFDWDVVEAAARIGFWPDLISTDLHSGNVNGPVRDLTTVASKFLNAGMPINDIITAMTWNPAKAILRDATLGSLSVTRDADITLLKIVEFQQDVEDSFGALRHLKQKIIPVGVFRDGVQFQIEEQD